MATAGGMLIRSAVPHWYFCQCRYRNLMHNRPVAFALTVAVKLLRFSRWKSAASFSIYLKPDIYEDLL